MKKLFLVGVTVVGLTMCHYAPAKNYDVVAQTTQIITPDGRLITCIQNGQLITCF
jgi:hypothetical protein